MSTASMGTSMMRAVVWLLPFALLGCRSIEPCGWDEALDLGASYDVELVEAYTSDSTTAFYSPDLDLTRPAPSCGALDGLAAGDALTLRLFDGPDASQRCSFWFAEIDSPSVPLGPRNPTVINNRSYNQIVASGRRDLGGGCEGNWEFSAHAPGNDPFMSQEPGSVPVVVAYRSFGAAAEANAACSALAGIEPTDESFVCGDAFVATMTPR